ncbi:non-hydrolyzing UDP-N-acetylglucosamine 2-epimerase [Croceicoccus mobilis]|uniref:non-hydrolyzing UDP-N-acetylglucosamine 2-epimerase n=1 Tax=Croceicoccus mobilis TaxID=1703339 RepID=UPI001E399BC0|nr:UDP-N-acetylglucosamine 2-epimerase (non-hydrolyzing) [Croceicoccus mobilis]
MLVVAGTRPEIIKLLPVMQTARARGDMAVELCHSGQHADLGREILNAAGVVPDHLLERPQARDTAALLAGLQANIGEVINRMKPRAVVVQGDTATTLAGALAAFHRQIPIAHVEAGLRSHDLASPWPEEGYRRMVSAIARWHFTPTPAATEALRRENVAQEAITHTGNSVIDTLHWAVSRLDAEPALGGEAARLIEGAKGRNLVLATVHRREADAQALGRIACGIRRLAEETGCHVAMPLHPRAESEILSEALSGHPQIALTGPLAYFAFLQLMRASRLILTDSGGVQEEAAALGRATLVLRDVTERPEAIAAGTAVLVGHDPDLMLAEARAALARPLPAPSDVFGDGRAGQRIVEVLARDL